MFYLNDISRLIIDDHLKTRCLWVLKERYRTITGTRTHKPITYRGWIDHKIGIIGLIFIIVIFPILSVAVLLMTLASVVYMPICNP